MNRRGSRGGRGNQHHIPTTNGPAQIRPPPSRQSSIASAAQQAPEATTTRSPTIFVPPPPVIVQPTEPQARKIPYEYQHITEELVRQWSEFGRKSIEEQAHRAVEDQNEDVLGAIFEELVQAALDIKVDAEDAGLVVKNIIGDQKLPNPHDGTAYLQLSQVQSTFLSTITIGAESGLIDFSHNALRLLVSAAAVPSQILRQELDTNVLQGLGLIRDSFGRMGIRKQTNILYRQANFNLMREESEGFSKLMTELFATSGDGPATAAAVEDTVERVKAMIGAFDLDVGRTLDVVLDVFGAVLIKQCKFFVKFLRSSPWWPRGKSSSPQQYLRMGGLPAWAYPGHAEWSLNAKEKAEMLDLRTQRDVAFWNKARDIGLRAYYDLGRSPAGISGVEMQEPSTEAAQNWKDATGTAPVVGNHDAAQLLGFKLRFYSSSQARDEHDVLPDNLIYLSALLIKIGFISLIDLYPHIWRSDEDMENLRSQKLIEKSDRERAARPGANSKNALMMAGALVDEDKPIPAIRLKEPDTHASTPSKEADVEKLSGPPEKRSVDPADQKVLLLKSLLAIGAIPEALYVLGRFPWIVDLYPDIPDYLLRIIHKSISKLYDPICPVRDRSSTVMQRSTAEADTPGLTTGQLRLSAAPSRKTLRWALLDRQDANADGCDYRFYWDEWADNVPICQTFDDFFTFCKTFVGIVGVKIGQDAALLITFARLGRHSLLLDNSDFNRARWLDLSKRLLVPALSLTKCNAGAVNEVFGLINMYSIETRYLIYLEWSSGKTSRNADVKAACDLAKAETKDCLKRISKTNLRPMARAFARVAYANPHIVIKTALDQIEMYDGVGDVFVEGARYFTDLGYDVLTWSLVSSMSRSGRSHLNEENVNLTSKWLQALSSFTGKIYKRYNIMRPAPVLQHVASQLERGNSTDLVVLEQLVYSMGGITSDTNYNEAQLQAMGGGHLFQAQTVLQLLDRRHESKLTSRRLLKTLKETELCEWLVALAPR